MSLSEKVISLFGEGKTDSPEYKSLLRKKEQLQSRISKLHDEIKDYQEEKKEIHPSAVNDDERKRLDSAIEARRKKIDQLEDELDDVGHDMHDLTDEDE